MTPIFSLRHLDVRYPGGVHAVREVTLALSPGRTLALLGANGAGKSSFIGALLGMIPATGEGEILDATFGKVPQRLFEKIGFVADGRTPPGHWTLDRYLAYLRPLYPTWDDNFAGELVSKFALPRNRKMSGFSRGMKMKAAMVGALAFRPVLLVLDEPFGGLDPLTREELIDGLLDLMEGGSWSMLLSSHDIHEVERLSDEVAILENGLATLLSPTARGAVSPRYSMGRSFRDAAISAGRHPILRYNAKTESQKGFRFLIASIFGTPRVF